jgi:hypothetical protein
VAAGKRLTDYQVLASEDVLTQPLAHALTHPFLRPGYVPLGPEEQRRQALSRTTSTMLVAALHVLFFFFFVFAVHPFDMRTRPIIETILTLPLAGNNHPLRDEDNPQVLTTAPPRILSAPITIPKPPPVKPEVERDNPGESNAPPTDILGAVGRELACSAGSWEHLTSTERERCGYGRSGGYPWKGARLPNGSIVMIPRSVLPRLADSPNPEFTVNTGAERIHSDTQRGIIPGQGGCPIMQNTPCLHVSPGMRDATGQN